MRPLCIYHGGCDDGFGAAFVVNLFFAGEVDFHYGVYHQEPPDVSGRDVLLVDFSYARAVLERMAKQARSIVILDHHKSAAEDLASFAVQDSGRDAARWHDVPRLLRELAALGRLPVVAVFDMSRSGAGLTWDFFFCSRPRPWLIDYIEDRDLWRKALPHSDEIIMALSSYPHDFETWQRIIDAGADALLPEGRAILRYHRTLVDALKRNAMRAVIGGVDVPVVNAPIQFASDVAGELAEGEPFAACYWIHPRGTTYSLRSRKGGMDVSEIAKLYGGGGHREAAGFTVDAPLTRISHRAFQSE